MRALIHQILDDELLPPDAPRKTARKPRREAAQPNPELFRRLMKLAEGRADALDLIKHLDVVKHPWRVLDAGTPTGRAFSNPHCAAVAALELERGTIDHPLHGAIGAAGCRRFLRKETTVVPKDESWGLPPPAREAA